MNAITMNIARDNDEDFAAAESALRSAATEIRDRADCIERGGDAERARVLRGRAITISAMVDHQPPERRSRVGVTAEDMSDWSVGEIEMHGRCIRAFRKAAAPHLLTLRTTLDALALIARGIPEEGDLRDTMIGAIEDVISMVSDEIDHNAMPLIEAADNAVDEALELANAA